MTELERQLLDENQQLREKIALLEQKIDLLIRQLYGAKSEKLDPDQLELLFGEDGPGKCAASAEDDPAAEDESSASPAEGKTRSKPRRPRIPEHLPVVEKILDPDPVKACPEAWRCIGEEVSEQLDYEPGRFLRRRLIRRKYVRRADPQQAPIIAPLPARLQERSIAAPGLLAHVAASKFCDHLPLYRQEQIFDTRYDVVLARQTLARWMWVVADWLQLVYQAMKVEMLSGGYLQVDETPIKYLEPGTGKAQQGYLWTYHVPGGDTIFDWQSSRAHACLEQIIPEEFTGVTQCDGYGAYRSFAAKRPGITLAGCWAHVRRKFFEARQSTGSDAERILHAIQKLYRIEAHLRESEASPERRREVRQVQSQPIVLSIHERLTHLVRQRAHLPQSAFGKAARYTLEQWDPLQVFLKDGRIEIDNNLVENSIRPTAIGKKNWLFLGRDDTGWRSAVIYSVLTSARNRGIEPYGYLKELLEILPRITNHKAARLTPAAWANGEHLPVLQEVA